MTCFGFPSKSRSVLLNLSQKMFFVVVVFGFFQRGSWFYLRCWPLISTKPPNRILSKMVDMTHPCYTWLLFNQFWSHSLLTGGTNARLKRPGPWESYSQRNVAKLFWSNIKKSCCFVGPTSPGCPYAPKNKPLAVCSRSLASPHQACGLMNTWGMGMSI